MIGRKIRQLRTEKGLSQQLAAESINVSCELYADYEIDKQTPNDEGLAKLANFFDVSTDYLQGFTALPKSYLLDKNSSAYKHVLEAVEKEGFTSDDIAKVNPQIAKHMQENKVLKVGLREKGNITIESLECVVSIAKQIKKDLAE